jgi:hypothetical protein
MGVKLGLSSKQFWSSESENRVLRRRLGSPQWMWDPRWAVALHSAAFRMRSFRSSSLGDKHETLSNHFESVLLEASVADIPNNFHEIPSKCLLKFSINRWFLNLFSLTAVWNCNIIAGTPMLTKKFFFNT